MGTPLFPCRKEISKFSMPTEYIVGERGRYFSKGYNSSLLGLQRQAQNLKKNNPEKKILSEYLKSIFKFDVDMAKDKNMVYKFNNKNNNNIIPSSPTLGWGQDNSIASFLEAYFLNLSSIISQPFISVTNNKIIIQLFYILRKKRIILFSAPTRKSSKKNKFNNTVKYSNEPIYSVFDGSLTYSTNQPKMKIKYRKINLICAYLSKLFKKEVVLDLVRLYYPYFESDILSNSLVKISNTPKRRIPFIFIMDRVLKNGHIKNPKKGIIQPKFTFIPTFLTGINIKLAGRLLVQRIVPRRTVKTAQQGTLSRAKSNLVLKGITTKTNKRGTFSLSVSIGHRFF